MNEKELINGFMGVVFHDDENKYYDVDGLYIGENIDYNTWNCLMPVIKRIREHVNVDMGFAEFDDWRENFKEIDPYNYSVEQCYKAVVEFIKYYNTKLTLK